MRYFSSVQGRAFLRPGRPGIYIGCKRRPRVKGVSPGFEWNPEVVTAVSEAECNLNLKDYNDAVRDGVLIVRTLEDFEAAAVAQAKAQTSAVKALAAAKAEATDPTTVAEES